MQNNDAVVSKVTATWQVGLLPALIVGIGTCLIARAYQIRGFKDGVIATGSSLEELEKAALDRLAKNNL